MHEFLLFLHVIGACVLLGTGAGIAFFMLVSHRSGDPGLIAHTAAIVVLADFVFTATAVFAQPVTGFLLVQQSGWPLDAGWLAVSIALYLLTGFFWLPVIVIQIRIRRLAEESRDAGTPLPQAYYRLFRIWFACGIPAFAAVLAILWLMLNKPGF